ncbi:AT-rich interactive domain-containing protein 6 [Malania oleifera]|uniref:AT-rich interactive domain-containing protein 6 n=1 Tax=Malania oleifera TaxID=397392 RepID=UPI0025ADBA3F|nr:AT-rich interactive domain-containing protein 6 [Malania oleifera]
MGDSERRGQDLQDGSEIDPVDAGVGHREEELPPAVEDQNPSENGQPLRESHTSNAHLSKDQDMIDNKESGDKAAPDDAVVKSDDIPLENQLGAATPPSLAKSSTILKVKNKDRPRMKSGPNDTEMAEADDSGSEEERVEFVKEVENFYREKSLEFKAPKFYGEPLNLLKLWKAVTGLGGYDTVTASKLWRQVGDSFHPPKTCTTVSWTFRIFYEKALLEYEKHKRQIGDLQLPDASLPEPASVENEAGGYQTSGSGRARRDAAARAMQGWHVQRLFGYGEVGEPIIKDKNFNSTTKREKNLKSIGLLKQKKPTNPEHAMKDADGAKQLVTTVVDVGPPADWVKINVRETKDCFEVYALVPGLLREEVRVQSDPAGRLVITGQPEQLDNPWGITPFKKVVSLPARIDPLQTSAVVSLHGRLFVRVPFEQSNF